MEREERRTCRRKRRRWLRRGGREGIDGGRGEERRMCRKKREREGERRETN